MSWSKKIVGPLSSRLALIFDGWNSGSMHYVAVYASFPCKSALGYETCLSEFSSFDDLTRQDAPNIFEFIEFVLGVYQKSLENVVALTGDNVLTNRSLVNKAKTDFIGCASHLFNLTVQDIVKVNDVPVEKVLSIMKKLRTPIPAVKLRLHTGLKAVIRNVTKWSSTCYMLRLY